MKYFKHIINDEIWCFYLTDKDNMDSLFDNSNVNPAAFTEPLKKEVYFDEAELSLIVVRHELTHVAFHYLFLQDSGVGFNELEEIFCEFIAHRLDWLNKLINEVHGKLLDLKKEKDNGN